MFISLGIIAICFTLLILLAGIFMKSYVEIHGMGKFAKFSSIAAIIFGATTFIGCLVICGMMLCCHKSHCGGKNQHCGKGMHYEKHMGCGADCKSGATDTHCEMKVEKKVIKVEK